MVEIQKPSTSARIRSYLDAHPSLTEGDEKTLKLENAQAIKEKMITHVQGAVDKFLLTDPPAKNGQKPDVFLENVLIDEKIPLRLDIQKRFLYTEQGEFKFQSLAFTLKKPGENLPVARFDLADYGDEFRLVHREVDSRYRRNGIADAGLKAVEEFIRGYVQKKPNREPVLEISAAQLDVINWFTKNGYETTGDPVPVRTGDKAIKVHDFDEILTSLETNDGKYEMDQKLYVFPSGFKGPRVLPADFIHEERVNYEEAARVHMRKRLDVPDNSEKQFPRLYDVVRRVRNLLSRFGI